MKLFIKKLCLFIIPIAILLLTGELTLQHIPNDYSYKNDLLRTNANDIEILVLGNSHTLYGINPDYFSKKGFNASHLAQSLKYDYFIFKKYKEKLKNLKVLVLPISYFSLFYKLEDSKARWRIKNYSLYYDCNYHSEFKYNNELLEQNPIISFKKIINYFSGQNAITVSESGFALIDTEERQTCLKLAGPIAAKWQTNFNLKLLEENYIILNEIIKESNEMGVKVILITLPARKSYIENLDKKQLSVMMEAINDILKIHPKVEYYNFLEDSRFTDYDFKDADHLKGGGAKTFTKIIDTIINKSDNIEDD